MCVCLSMERIWISHHEHQSAAFRRAMCISSLSLSGCESSNGKYVFWLGCLRLSHSGESVHQMIQSETERKKNFAKWDRRVRKRRKSSTVFHPNIIHFSCKICYSACTCTHHILKDFMVFAFKHILSSLVSPTPLLKCAHIFSRSFACNLYYFHQAIFLSMNFYGKFHSNSNVSRLLQFHFSVCVYFGVYLLFYFIFCSNWVRRMHRYAQISDRNVSNTKPIKKLIVHSAALRERSNDFLIFGFRRIIWVVENHFKWLLTFPKSLTRQSFSINASISIRFLFISSTFVMNFTKLKQMLFGREGVQIEPIRFRSVSSRKIKSKNPSN